MRPHQAQRQSRPQISTMPHQNTEATAYLDIYKLVNEKKRLQKELESLEQRRDRVQQRLAAIESQVVELKGTADQLRSPLPNTARLVAPTQSVELGSFNTLFLEY